MNECQDWKIILFNLLILERVPNGWECVFSGMPAFTFTPSSSPQVRFHPKISIWVMPEPFLHLAETSHVTIWDNSFCYDLSTSRWWDWEKILLGDELCPPKPSIEGLPPVPQNVASFGDRTFKEGIKVVGVSPNPIWLLSLLEGEIWTHRETPGLCAQRDDQVMKGSKEATCEPRRETPQRKPSLLAPWYWTFWNCEQISVI